MTVKRFVKKPQPIGFRILSGAYNEHQVEVGKTKTKEEANALCVLLLGRHSNLSIKPVYPIGCGIVS